MKILISGAGIAGLALARALQDNDQFQITLIEKRPKPSIHTAGIALPPNAVAALRKLNLGPKLDSIAHQVHTIFYTDAQQKVLVEASLLEPPLNYDKFVALSRADLRKILAEDLSVPIKYGTTITKIENTPDYARVTLNDDPATQDDYDLVVAADGIHSTLRETEAEHNGPLKDLGLINWRFLLNCPTQDIEPTYQFGDKQSKLFLTYPISENQVYIYAHIRDSKENPLIVLNNIQQFKANFSEFGGLAGRMLSLLDDNVSLIPGRLQSVPNANFYKNRVAFVGDVANACSPMLQQGAAAALEDILTLATMLQNYPIPKALESYKAFRKERVEWLIKSSDGPLAMMENVNRKLGDWLGSFIRNLLFKFKGPLNVAGWRTLLATNPLIALDKMKPLPVSKKYTSEDGDKKTRRGSSSKHSSVVPVGPASRPSLPRKCKKIR